MQTPLEIIAGYGVNTTSYVRAMHDFNDPDNPIELTQRQYEQGIADILAAEGSPCFSNIKEARLYFMYLVQETIRAYQIDVPDMAEVWEEAQYRAQKLIEKAPWSIKEYASEVSEQTEEDGTPKQKKGAKKEQSEALYLEMNDGVTDRLQIVQAFQDELGMSKAGATTYFHNMKNKHGYDGPVVSAKKKKKAAVAKPAKKAAKIKKKPKSLIAREIYSEMVGADKADVIARIVAEAKTTQAGANTYYCSAKRELEGS